MNKRKETIDSIELDTVKLTGAETLVVYFICVARNVCSL